MSVHTYEIITTTIRKFFLPKEDLTSPISTRRLTLQLGDAVFNSAAIHVRQSLGQRCKIRVSFEALTRYSGRSTYRRLKNQVVYLDCPNARQAEFAIEAILSFAQSLDGIWLTEPEQQAQSNQVDANLTEIGDQSAVDLQAEQSEDLAVSPKDQTQDLDQK